MSRLTQQPYRAALTTLWLLVVAALPAYGDDSMRCGTHLVSSGDRTFEVRQKCGEPTHLDSIGYTTGYYNNRELKLQEWVYGPINGMLYILTFEGNRLTTIETRRNR